MNIKTEHIANVTQIDNATDVVFETYDMPVEYSTTHHYAFTITINPNDKIEAFAVE
jgi:hypothetical protein